MNKLFIFVSLLLFINCETIRKSEPCTCTQMLTQVDCSKKKDCIWDKSKYQCIDYKIEMNIQHAAYCNQYMNKENCSSVFQCSWDEDRCTHFTGCTAFFYDTHQKCQAISHRCISDGLHCVEIGDCQSYLSPISCINNSVGQYCYWNASQAICQDADECSKLPQILDSDSQCRAQISKCTAQIGGGCVEEGNNCYDQDDQINCVYNKKNNQICFWLDGKCLDKICKNAPQTLTTDKQCQDFHPSCTTKQEGGCIDRLLCSTYQIKEACKKDAIGNDCYWTGKQCVDKICENALNTYKTNEICQEYLDTCITNGKGCVLNSNCGAAIIQDACNKTMYGTLCHWNGNVCVPKTCKNAGPSYIGHDQCTQYMDTCTESTDESTGCTERTCDNAPSSFNTYTQCMNYIQNGNCIPQFGGGCRINTKCEDNMLKESCVRDVNNQECFWWNGKCELKICENAPLEFNTHELCYEFMNTCTIGSDQRCVSLTCENIQEKSNCKFDLNNKTCIFNEGCFKKYCALAPKYLQKFNDCQTYLSSCTVDNSGSGCMELPIICEAITRSEGCYLTAGRKECGWYKGVCIEKSCQTASQALHSTFECSHYMVGCVVNNDLAGCMKPPNQCDQRQHQQNCLYEQFEGLQPRCFWSQASYFYGLCSDITCENAHLYFELSVTQYDCWDFYGLKCVLDNTSNRCLARPKYCYGLGVEACTWNRVLENDQNCYWNAELSLCRDYSCSSITLQLYSHESCQQAMQQCTVNYNGCTDLLNCSQYVSEYQCVLSKDYNKCIWFNQQCIDIPCNQEIQSEDFNQCQSISKNCVPTTLKCTLKKSKCEDFKSKKLCEQSTIDWKMICRWNGWNCENVYNYSTSDFDCYSVKANGLTYGYCQFINSNCSVNIQGSSCIKADYCMQYKEDQCLWGIDGECIWNKNYCQQRSLDCEYAKPPYTADTCQTHNYSCTIKIDGTGCVQIVDTCQITPLENCIRSWNSYCYKKQFEDICISPWEYPLSNSDCSQVKGKGLNFDYCYGISYGQCSVNASGTSCVTIRNQCSQYTQEQCRQLTYANCIFIESYQQCIEFYIWNNSCTDIKLYQLASYSDFLCKAYHYTCNAYEDGSGCYSNQMPRVDCEKAIQPFTYYNCFIYSSLCSVNAAKTKCILAKNTCAEYQLDDCDHAIDEGEYDGCYNKRKCNQYKEKKSCIINTQGEDCLWNPSTGKCLDKTCQNAEASDYFDSHEECINIGKCTVKASVNYTIGQGCRPLGPCKSYVIIEQCVKNFEDQECIWNTNVSPAQCNDKSCEAAELFRVDHEACQTYLNVCTVRVIEIEGMFVSQGCIQLKNSCDQYIHQNQCNIDAFGNICGWNGDSCEKQSCNTAPAYINLPQLCQQYQDGCTIHPTNCGCTRIPDSCEEMTQNQCYNGSINSKQQECYWDQNQMKCILKICELIPISYSEYECSNFLDYCTMSSQRCRNTICEDYSLTSDHQCRNIMSMCTTNGVYCVKRGSCLQAQSEAGCVTDSNGRQCTWINRLNKQSYCKIKSCETAPLYLNTEQQCQEYFQPTIGSCTTTKFGGCVLKGTCFDANVLNACTTSNIGEICLWDENLNMCRIKQCQDYFGTTHQECQSKRQECTVGFNSKCVKITSCQETKFKAACIEGTDGPCLWISKYKNQDNSLGACFRYDSCKSLKWNSHAQCQEISTKCTTDGNQCVSITSCEQTNLNGGCVIGIDNIGIQKCIIVSESQKKVCRTFNKCTDIHYLTHEECQQASSLCTSDYQNGCIQLQPCFKYKYEQCHINHMGIIKDVNGEISSTGICIWDLKTSQCRDEECSDIISTTHLECQSRLSYCTTNGYKCILKESCSSYFSQEICENAEGLDDKSFELCRKMNCEDIPNGHIYSSCKQIENCISNGIQCINKAKCSDYNINQTCYYEGLDGICVWIENQSQNNKLKQCKLMESCESAKNDINACKLVKDKCYWNSDKCQTHTCQTYSTQIGSCKNFNTWDNKQIHLCHYHEQQCVTININTLKQVDCYIKTAKLHRWDPNKSLCASCEKSVRLITEFSDILGILIISLFLSY
ncbi:unnamed protein product [Paramecium pentaurelia]|uniref:PSI domain-containing protein n=1 Tax=Paramecium pentaurelia TaxID=43138 RepID=A0A8S1XSH4_9CILI|nr:unnamed protein product [Paramecium pentaurelia]